MENSYLITVLRTLDKKEIRDFKKWLISPAHNQREDVEDLFHYLTSSNHLEEDKYLQKERVFKKVFPKEAFDDAKLRQTIHFLTKSVEDFLVFNEWNSNDIRFQITLAGIYRKRNLEKAFRKTMRSSEIKQKNSPYRNNVYLENEYMLQNEKYAFWSGRTKRQSTFNFQEISDALDAMYITNKLKLLCFSFSHKAVVKADYDIGFEEEVLQYIEQKDLYERPAVGIYYYIFKALKNPEETQYYEQLKRQIQDYGGYFPDSELNDIVLLALNYCMGRINAGEKKFNREAFEYQQMGIERDIFLENNQIDSTTFRNIVVNGSILNEFDWVEQFIDSYQKYLPASDREKMSHYCKAILFFIKGDYEKCRDLLIHFDYDDILLTTQAKSMLIRLYYEQDEYDLLEALLESTRNYLARKKVMGYRREQVMSMIRLTRKLVRVNPYDEKRKEKLKQEIVQAKYFAEKGWLLRQVETL
jgi:hypothetical protein